MTEMTIKTYAIGVALLVFCGAVCCDTYAVVTLHTHLISGVQAPGTEPGVAFSDFGLYRHSLDGDVLFEAELVGSGIDETNNRGIWSYNSGSLELVARTGDVAPGTGTGVYFSYLSTKGFNDSGQALISGNLTGSGVDDTNGDGLWLGTPGSMDLLLRAGDPAAGIEPGVVYKGAPYNTELSNNGQANIACYLDGPDIDNDNEYGIWAVNDGVIRKVIREGDPVPGMSPGVVFIGVPGSYRVNENGQLLMKALIAGSGISGEYNGTLWLDTAGSLSLVARNGDPAPDMDPGVVFDHINYGLLNSQSLAAINADITGPGINDSNNLGIWAKDNGSMQLVAQTGDLAVGWRQSNNNARFTDIHNLAVNEAGHVRLLATVNNYRHGIWSNHNGSLELLVREGIQAPGTEPGVYFNGIFGTTDVNSSGQFAFVSSLDGPGITTDNNYGLWIGDSNGQFHLVLRKGDVVDVNDDPLIEDLRTIDFQRLYQVYSFNDQGEMSFSTMFTDGSEGYFTVAARLPGDLDGDGFVGIEDLNIILSYWDQSVSPGHEDYGDYTGDGFVGIEDLNVVLSNWNAGTPPGEGSMGTIPEPVTGVVMFVLGVPLIGRRGR